MATTKQEQLNSAVDQLENSGLNLFAIIRTGQLPDSAKAIFDDLTIPPSDENRIVLIGHGGRRLWSALKPSHWRHSDPIDNFSHAAAQQFCHQILERDRYQIIYPGIRPVALQQLGRAAGWHYDSPLGLGINPQWGLWYAYRAAILTDANLPLTVSPPASSPCIDCPDQPCINHCPAQALDAARPINMSRCGDYRLEEDSACADHCLARTSCPVAEQHRYTLEQIRYHYRLSLETLRHYQGHRK